MIPLDQVALILDDIDEDPRLTSLIDEQTMPGANAFHQRVRYLRQRAQQSDRAGVAQGLQELLEVCQGALGPWRAKIDSASKLLG